MRISRAHVALFYGSVLLRLNSDNCGAIFMDIAVGLSWATKGQELSEILFHNQSNGIESFEIHRSRPSVIIFGPTPRSIIASSSH